MMNTHVANSSVYSREALNHTIHLGGLLTHDQGVLKQNMMNIRMQDRDAPLSGIAALDYSNNSLKAHQPTSLTVK